MVKYKINNLMQYRGKSIPEGGKNWETNYHVIVGDYIIFNADTDEEVEFIVKSRIHDVDDEVIILVVE